MHLDGFNEQFVRDQALAAGYVSVEHYVRSLLEQDAERLAIQEGLDALREGRSKDFDDFDREFRARNGITADT